MADQVCTLTSVAASAVLAGHEIDQVGLMLAADREGFPEAGRRDRLLQEQGEEGSWQGEPHELACWHAEQC